MVINYTEDDGYDIPTKEYLLGKIKVCTTFSKFDCKSGFWQVKMHLDSIPWTVFSCPKWHFEWLVMYHQYSKGRWIISLEIMIHLW